MWVCVCGFMYLFWEKRKLTLWVNKYFFSNLICGMKMISVLISISQLPSNRYFRVQFYASTTIHVCPSPYISTSEQIDSISILLRSAGGRELFCRKKLIVSLRWNHFTRSTAKVRNAIDSSRHCWLVRDWSLFATLATSQLFGAYWSRGWHNINFNR